MPSLISLASLALASAASGTAHGQTLTRLAGGRERLFAIRDASVAAFDRDGRLRGTCSDFAARPVRAEARPRVSALEGTDLLRLAGLPDDEEQSPEAEEVLAEEGVLGGRHRGVSAPPAIEPRALAVDPESDDAWIATSGGLFRGKDGVCRLAALERRDLLLVVAGDAGVFAAGEGLLWRLARGGSAFEIAAGLVAVPRALAMQSDGRVYVADDDGVMEIAPAGAPRRILDVSTDALAVCDGVTLALTGRGVYRWSAGEIPTRVADRPPARAIACGSSADARFVATGLGVWTSPDGLVWTGRPEWLGRFVAGAATLARVTWLAVDDRLLPLGSQAPGPAGREHSSADPSTTLARPDVIGATSTTARPPRLDPLPVSRLRTTWFPWPRLTVLFAAQHTASRSGWSIEIALAFPFGRAAAPRTDGARLAAELLSRDARLAREEASLAAAAAWSPTEEQAAQLQVLRQERAALR